MKMDVILAVEMSNSESSARSKTLCFKKSSVAENLFNQKLPTKGICRFALMRASPCYDQLSQNSTEIGSTLYLLGQAKKEVYASRLIIQNAQVITNGSTLIRGSE